MRDNVAVKWTVRRLGHYDQIASHYRNWRWAPSCMIKTRWACMLEIETLDDLPASSWLCLPRCGLEYVLKTMSSHGGTRFEAPPSEESAAWAMLARWE